MTHLGSPEKQGRDVERSGIGHACRKTSRPLLTRHDLDIEGIAAELSAPADQIRAALDQLVTPAPPRPSRESPPLPPVNPEVGLRALLPRHQAELLRRRQEFAESQAAMTQLISEYVNLETDVSRPDTERLIGMEAIRSRIERLALRAEIEVASLMTAAPRDPAVIDSAITLVRRVRERGVTIRSVGMDCLREAPAPLTYARRLVEIGAEVRVAPTLPVRVLIYDRQVALVPFDPANSAAGAVQVTGRGTVAAILALFEQVWASALPIDSIPARDDAGLSPQERELLRLLAEGLTDARAGRHLGISPRTVRRTVADMMSRLGARSRFEAGLRAAERGWI